MILRLIEGMVTGGVYLGVVFRPAGVLFIIVCFLLMNFVIRGEFFIC